MTVSFDDVAHAAQVLSGHALRTPVHTSTFLNEITGASVFLKCENFQRTGAFKFRGGFNALSKIALKDRSRGVLTYSSGNHAQALSLAGSLLEIPVSVIMPDDAPEIKKRATAGYGAEIILYNKFEISREELAAKIAKERDLPIIPPYDHVDVIAGQGTAALELHQEVESLDFLLAPCGGGGLLSGTAIATKHQRPGCFVAGVEPANADDATRSFRTGILHTVENPDTIADGARTPYLGKITFPIILEKVDDMLTVSEEAIIRAMTIVWERMKLVVEPTGALAIAAILDSQMDLRGARVGIIVSGGNVDIRSVSSLFSRLPADLT